MKLRDLILSQFEPDIAIPLLEFGKSLSQIDADVLVFMARKSLCLYDVLLRLGIKPAEQRVISDRVLDMRLDPLVGKKIALIDDTVIVGTTLAKTKRLLESSADAKVTVHTFCVNTDWWCKDLLKPDSISLELSDERLMTFCTAEVRALSLLPRPYLVDFPLSRSIRIRNSDSHEMLSSVEWESYNISTQLQERHGVKVFTFFPREEVLSEFAMRNGNQLTSCLEIVKVRVFLRRYKDVSWVRAVPIVTLKPLLEKDIDLLHQHIVNQVAIASGEDLTRLGYFANSVRARQRLVQYALSAALGQRFMKSLKAAIGASVETGYDLEETDRHYGPWLHNEMSIMTQHAYGVFWDSQKGKTAAASMITEVLPTSLPVSIQEWTEESLKTIADAEIISQSGEQNKSRPSIANFVTDLTEILLHLFDSKEIPARNEARELGIKILDAKPEDAPHRDRLDIGISWQSLVAQVSAKYGLSTVSCIPNLLSLALDLCNDLGIAVPITCAREGVVFRAYRHGEDVKFSDAELVLAREALKGFLEATGKKSIQRLVLEKLLVILIRVGAARGFLEPLYGTSGVEGVVRIGFDLKGARPVLVRGPHDWTDRNMWLSSYLVRRKVIRVQAGGQYSLGTEITGNYLSPTAPDDAYEIGNIVGMLLKSSRSPRQPAAPLDNNALMILATCWHPKDVSRAIEVELDIFRRWYEDEGRNLLNGIDWNNELSVENGVKSLLRSVGYEALHSARLKFVAYRTKRAQLIVKECTSYLEADFRTNLLSRRWQGYWNSMDELRPVHEERTFRPFIIRSGTLCWNVAACILAIEVTLTGHLAKKYGNQTVSLDEAIKKFKSYSDGFQSTSLDQPGTVSLISKPFGNFEKSRIQDLDFPTIYHQSIQTLEPHLLEISGFVETLDPMINDFGKLSGRHDYSHMVWYDIRDSTGGKAGTQNLDLEQYRTRIRTYKGIVNNQLQSLTITARKNACQIYCWNGNMNSLNDEKHIFFSGEFALRHVSNVLTALLTPTKAWGDICVRVCIVPCNFAGTRAYRMGLNTEIEGERFWEHWSRLKKAIIAFDTTCNRRYSMLAVVTDEMISNFTLPQSIDWIEVRNASVKSEIEMLARTTVVRYGSIQV